MSLFILLIYEKSISEKERKKVEEEKTKKYRERRKLEYYAQNSYCPN